MKTERLGRRCSWDARVTRWLWGAAILCAAAWSGRGEAAPAGQQVVVTGDNVNVRSRPSVKGQVLTQVNSGTVLTLVEKVSSTSPGLGEPAAWARIQLPATVPVWVHSSFVQGDTVRANHLNLRSGPGESYGVLGQLNSGEKVSPLARQGDWIKIAPPPRVEAFIAAEYVRPVPATAAPPVVAAVPAGPAPAPAAAAPSPLVQTPELPKEPTPAVTAAPAVTAPPVATPPPAAAEPKAAAAPAALPATPDQVAELQPPPKPPPSDLFDTTAPPTLALVKPPPETLNSFSAGWFMTWNMSAQFRNSGSSLFPTPTGGHYDDGFVLPGSRGNADGYTWNWGYQHASQYNPATDQLIMSRASVVPGGSYGSMPGTSSGDLNQGVEFVFHRILWQQPGDAAAVGFEVAFSYASMDFNVGQSAMANVQVSRDAYALQGVHPPPAPYSGTFAGPGALLFSQPQHLPSETIPDGTTILSQRSLDLDMFNLRLGPRLSFALSPRLVGMASAGLDVMIMDGTFSYHDTASGTLNAEVSGHGEQVSVLPGGYVGLGLEYHLNDNWGLTYQVHFQYNQSYNQNIGGRSVELGLDPSISQMIGVSYSF